MKSVLNLNLYLLVFNHFINYCKIGDNKAGSFCRYGWFQDPHFQNAQFESLKGLFTIKWLNMAISTFYVQSEQKTVTMQQMLNSYYFNDFFRAYDKTGFVFAHLKTSSFGFIS